MRDSQEETRTYEVVRVRAGQKDLSQDQVAVEKAYDLVCEGQVVFRFHASPHDLRSLALGHLYNTGQVSSREDLLEFAIEGDRLLVALPSGACRPQAQSPPPCQVATDRLWSWMRRMEEDISVFQETGGVHGGALWDRHGRCQALAWDVARHNVLDKLCGQVLDKGISPRGMVLTFTGRQALAIVEKALSMEVSLLAGISAPSSLGVDLARQGGMGLVGFTRPGRMTLYSRPDWVKVVPAASQKPLVVTVTAARSGSGKTTVILGLLDLLSDLKVGVIKSSSHPYSMDKTKDSSRFYDRGACLVVYQGPDGTHTHRKGFHEAPKDLVGCLSQGLDLILIESREVREGVILEVVRGREGLAAYADRPRPDLILTDMKGDIDHSAVFDLGDLMPLADHLRREIAGRKA